MVYKIKKTLWHQPPLFYGESLEVWDLIGDKIVAALDENAVLGVLGEIKREGSLPALYGIILKPYQPTILHRMWNAYHAKRNGVRTGRALIESMDLPTVARVGLDFFLVNGRWISQFLNSRLGSWSPFRKKQTVMGGILALSSAYSTLQTAILKRGDGLPVNQPSK